MAMVPPIDAAPLLLQDNRGFSLHLLADDLTGALDTASQFASAFGGVEVFVSPKFVETKAQSRACAFHSASRELSAMEAAECARALSPLLAPYPAYVGKSVIGEASHKRINFFKVDSLLRGHAGHELAVILQENCYDHVIIAPAIPSLGRITRAGRQCVVEAGLWRATGEDLGATLSAQGHDVQHFANLDASAGIAKGIAYFSFETDAMLETLAAKGLVLEGSILWVGAAGLAAALAKALVELQNGAVQDVINIASTRLKRPLLGFIGTDHPVMRGQLAGIDQRFVHAADGSEASMALIQKALHDDGIAFVTPALPLLSRREAQDRIAKIFAKLAHALHNSAAPATIFVSGGETLFALAQNIGVDRLSLCGDFSRGAPLSYLQGGQWQNTALISKSGAFGTPDFLQNLLTYLEP